MDLIDKQRFKDLFPSFLLSKTETYFPVIYYFRHGAEIRRHNYHVAIPNDFKLNKYKTIDSNNIKNR